jgi:hypothetical protein
MYRGTRLDNLLLSGLAAAITPKSLEPFTRNKRDDDWPGE